MTGQIGTSGVPGRDLSTGSEAYFAITAPGLEELTALELRSLGLFEPGEGAHPVGERRRGIQRRA